MAMVGRKVLVLSGKGGVGKSTVAANLALGLAAAGRKVGLLDVDVHGPSIPQLLGLRGRAAEIAHGAILPIQLTDNLSVMSIAFLMQGAGEAVIWRGPMKAGVIRQFLQDVEWGPLDFLVVDSPPGTGDEPLSVAQNVGAHAAALIVTTPQDLAVSDVRRCVTFCRALSLPILGIVENMSGLTCPHCGERIDLFKTGGGAALAAEADVPFLGRIPIDPAIVTSGDEGRPPAAEPFAALVQQVLAAPGEGAP
jgi:Mrp family chromosome partitioning ATPase